ncbi:MAG: hypothetical protein R3B70_09535 [Polyangiaceae bacterium]
MTPLAARPLPARARPPMPLRSARPLLVALTSLALTLTACGDDHRASDKGLHQSLEQLRSSTEAADRRAKLAALKAFAAESPAAKAAQTACVRAYEKLFEAEDAIAAAEATMKAAAAGGAPLDPARSQLTRATASLDEADKAMADCDTAASRLTILVR